MVGCTLWPTITGAGGHLMALWNTTINIVSFGCTATATSFTVSALRQVGALRMTMWWRARVGAGCAAL